MKKKKLILLLFAALNSTLLAAQDIMAGAMTMPETIAPITPSYRNITFKDITIENCKRVIDLIGLPETPVTQVLIDRMKVANSEQLIAAQDVDGLVISNSTIRSSSK